jgi:hypothetical protein
MYYRSSITVLATSVNEKFNTVNEKFNTVNAKIDSQTIKIGFGGTLLGGAFSLALAYFKALPFVNYAESAKK